MSITRSRSNANITHLMVPPLYGQRMRYCQPIPVYLKIRTLAANAISNSDVRAEKANVLCRKQENLQRCRDDSTLCQSRVEGRHPRPPPPNSSAHSLGKSSEIDRMISAAHGPHQISGCATKLVANPCSSYE